LSIRLSELTKADVSKDPSGEPNHLLIRFTNPEVFDCPFVMATEVGRTFITDDEAKAMRLYLEKGGFLWVDDFWGSYAWEHWVGRLMVLMTHHTDFGDSWEREGDSPEYFIAVGPRGYAFGINAVLYALTH